jgi:outer membrane receptor protein involved in Fe transport
MKKIGFIFLLLFLKLSVLYAQQINLEGKVVNKHTKQPIEYVNIHILNTLKGTVTDSSGYFVIQINPKKQKKLIISHTAYFKQEILLSSIYTKSELLICMKPKIEKMEEVVISASRYPQKISEIPKPVNIVYHREMLDKMQSNVIDVISGVPGITKIWEYHSPLLLRGMNSKRLIVLKNGNRRIGTFPGGFFAQSMNIYDARQIDIIKGPGSVIYGSGAISGIINVISPEPFGNKKTNINIHFGYGSNNNEFLEIAKVCITRQKYGIKVSGKYRKTGNYYYGDGIEAKNSNIEDRDMSIHTGYKPANNHKLIIDFDYHWGDWGKPRGFNGPDKAFTKVRNQEENYHTSMKYIIKVKKRLKEIHFSTYFDHGQRDYYKYKFSTITDKCTSLDLVHYKYDYSGGQLYGIFEFPGDHKLITGINGYIFRLGNPAELFDYYENTHGTQGGYKDAGQQVGGVFMQDEWKIDKKFKLISGIRYDLAKVKEGVNSNLTSKEKKESRYAISGNLGGVYHIQDNQKLTLNLGHAFRMPNAEELFTEVISCKGIKLGNPDLKPEYSWNFDLGYKGKYKQLKWELNLFYNLIDDYINETLDTVHENVDFTYINTNAEIWGGEFTGSYNLENVFKTNNTLIPEIGMSYIYGNDLSDPDNPSPLFGIPPFLIKSNLTYYGFFTKSFVNGYFLKIEAEYAAPQDRIPELPEGSNTGPWGYIPSEQHWVFNMVLGVNVNRITGQPKFRIQINNIFGLDYKPFGSYIPAMGRNIKIILSLKF